MLRICEAKEDVATFEAWAFWRFKAEPLVENRIHVTRNVSLTDGGKEFKFCEMCRDFIGVDWGEDMIYGKRLSEWRNKYETWKKLEDSYIKKNPD